MTRSGHRITDLLWWEDGCNWATSTPKTRSRVWGTAPSSLPVAFYFHYGYDEVVMQTRSSVSVVGRILLLVALVVATGLGSAARASCAEHGLGGLALVGHAAPAGAATHHAAHHGHGHSGNDHSEGCCCAGECAGVAQLATLPPSITIRVAVSVAEPARAFDLRTGQAPVADPDRLLPFANGPPVATSV
jgi:hypothetical protein